MTETEWEGCPNCGETVFIASRVMSQHYNCTIQIEGDGSYVPSLDGEETNRAIIEPANNAVYCANCKTGWRTIQELFREAGLDV